jgi:hypothetical protein
MHKLIILLALTVVAARSQMIYGSWHCQDYDWSLELTEDGQYTSQYPGGTSVGRYFIDGYLVSLQDASTMAVATYTFQFAGDVMRFIDQVGVNYVFIRKGSAAENLPPEVIIGDPAFVSSPALAEKDGFVLREDDTRTAFELLELIIGKRVSEEEGGELLDAWIAEFQKDPAGFKEKLGEWTAVRDEFYRTNDPWQVGKIREKFLGELYQAKESEQDAFSSAVYRHLKVLAFDKKEKLALTDKDVESYLDYAAFLVKLSTGKEIEPSSSQRSSQAEQIVKEFVNYPLEVKRFLSRSQVVYTYLTYVWGNADTEERDLAAQGILEKGKVSAFDAASVLDFDHIGAMNAWKSIIELPYYYEIN